MACCDAAVLDASRVAATSFGPRRASRGPAGGIKRDLGSRKLFPRCAGIPVLAQSVGMEITYELTQRDFYDSLIAHRNGSTFRKWTFRLIAFFIFLVAASGLITVILRPQNTATRADLLPMFIVVAVWGIVLWGGPRLSARSQYRKQPAAQGARTLRTDAAGVHWRWSGGASDVEWKTYMRYVESKRQFLLYLSPAMFNMVPKRALTPEQISEFRMLLAQNISRSR